MYERDEVSRSDLAQGTRTIRKTKEGSEWTIERPARYIGYSVLHDSRFFGKACGFIFDWSSFVSTNSNNEWETHGGR